MTVVAEDRKFLTSKVDLQFLHYHSPFLVRIGFSKAALVHRSCIPASSSFGLQKIFHYEKIPGISLPHVSIKIACNRPLSAPNVEDQALFTLYWIAIVAPQLLYRIGVLQ